MKIKGANYIQKALCCQENLTPQAILPKHIEGKKIQEP